MRPLHLQIGLIALEKMAKINNALGLVRKYLIISDTVVNTPKHITRAAAIAIFKDPLPNPASGRVEDLSPLYDVGSEIGDVLMKKILPLFPDQGDIVSYGKAGMASADNDLEKIGALIHPQLGSVMRPPLNGGTVCIPSNMKTGGPGTVIDVPLAHKDDIWSFPHWDTISVSCEDGPNSGELMMIVALADGGRPFARVNPTKTHQMFNERRQK